MLGLAAQAVESRAPQAAAGGMGLGIQQNDAITAIADIVKRNMQVQLQAVQEHLDRRSSHLAVHFKELHDTESRHWESQRKEERRIWQAEFNEAKRIWQAELNEETRPAPAAGFAGQLPHTPLQIYCTE